MPALTLLLLGLLASQAPKEETDPEPPRPGPVELRLWSRKGTYKIDRQGMTEKEFLEAIKAGKARPVAVELELTVRNNTKKEIRVRTSGLLPKLLLTLKGKGALDSPNTRKAHQGVLRYTVLKPGEKVSIPIDTLMTYEGHTGGTINHYWTEPGEYTLAASFHTAFEMDWANGGDRGKTSYTTLTARPITLKVEK